VELAGLLQQLPPHKDAALLRGQGGEQHPGASFRSAMG
jgi:hypothetical protein